MAEIHLKYVAGNRSTAIMDVVFVHGLIGDDRDTWQHDADNPATFWPAWLAEDVPEISVWTLGYPNPMSEWAAEAMSLYERAVNALSHLYGPERLGSRPQVFVAHSFGGLLVKKMLNLGITMHQDEWIGTHMTVGVVFLATPHSGTELARLATKIKSFRASKAVQDLVNHSGQLTMLRDWFEQYSHHVALAVGNYYETHQLSRLMRPILDLLHIPIMVVERESASGHGLSIPVDADHFQISKLPTRETVVYDKTKQLILRVLAKLKTVMQIKSPCFIAVAGSHDEQSRASVIRFSGVYTIVHTIELCYELGIKYGLELVDRRARNDIAKRDIISLGGPISNELTTHYLVKCVPGVVMVNPENHPRGIPSGWQMRYERLPSHSTQGGFRVGDRCFLCERDKDYGFIVKLPRETTKGENTVFLIFGWSSNASAGAAYYLLRFHRKLYDTFRENKFCVAVEVPKQGLSLITEEDSENVTEAAFQAHEAASSITPAL